MLITHTLLMDSGLFTLKHLDFFPHLMRKLKYTIRRNAFNQMYMSYMLPVTEYASIVWDGCTAQDSQTLQKIQNEAALLVTDLTRYVSLENMYKECRWATLSQRRHQHKLSFM